MTDPPPCQSFITYGYYLGMFLQKSPHHRDAKDAQSVRAEGDRQSLPLARVST